jgi:valyl-tRNA synthetase
VLRLLHPFMPHITEELWSLLGFGKDSIQFTQLPKPLELDDVDLADKRKLVVAIYETVQTGRNLRAAAKIPSNQKAQFILRADRKEIMRETPTIARLLNAEEFKLDRQYKAQPGVPMAVTPLGEIFLAIGSADKAAERERLDKEIAKMENQLRTVDAKLKNRSFVDRAPAAVVKEHRQRLKDLTVQLGKLKQAREGLN